MARKKKKRANPFEPRRRARRRALQALYQWHLNDDTAASIIEQFLEEQQFADVDVDYFRELVRNVIQLGEELDSHLDPHVKRLNTSLDPMERVILRIGALELLRHPEIPYRVVIDEAVDLAHRFGAEQGHTFINGVLDRLARESRSIEQNAEQTAKAEAAQVGKSNAETAAESGPADDAADHSDDEADDDAAVDAKRQQ